MFHIVLAIASRFLYFGNALQGFARGILALRNLGIISSNLITALSPPPPIALLDAPVPFVGLPEEIIPPYPSVGLIAHERIERQPPAFVSPIPSYQSSLTTVSSSQLPIILPLFIILLAIISGFVLLLPVIMDSFMNVANIIVTFLKRCGLLAVQDTQTPLLNVIYEQITRGAAGFDNLVDGSDISYGYTEDQIATDGSLRYPNLAHDEIPEEYRLRLQNIYTQFVDSNNCLREQLELSRAHQQELHTDLRAAEHERERLISTLGESDKKWRSAKARNAEAEAIASKLRADLTVAMDCLDRQMEVTSSKDHTIQSVTEESQVVHVRLKYAEDKIIHLNAKLQRERDRRLRKTKELLEEQVWVQDSHEAEIHRLKQEAQDAQEQLDNLRGMMSQLHADGLSPLNHDRSACYRQPTTRPCDTCEPPLPPERIHDTGTPISSATDIDSSLLSTKSSPYSPGKDQEDSSTRQQQTPEVTQVHQADPKKLTEQIRQGESESAQDPEKHDSELRESRLQDELTVTKERLYLAEEEVLTMHRDLDESREAFQELKSHIVTIQFEWEMCKAMLREAQDARRSSSTELAEVIELLRVSQAESEESQFKYSQVKVLCAALQERVTDIEAKLQHPDSIYMTIPPLLPRILDFSLPTSLSPFTSLSCESITSHHHEVGLHKDQDVQHSTELVRSSVDPGSANPELTDLSHHLPPPSPSSEENSRLLSPLCRIFLSERNGPGSMDWPPIGSALSPGRGDVRRDREEDVGFQTEESTDDPIPCYQELLPPFQGSEPADMKDLKTLASRTSSSFRDVRDIPLRPQHYSPPPIFKPVTIDSASRTVQLRKGGWRPSHRRVSSHIPIERLEYSLPVDFVPSFKTTSPKRQDGNELFEFVIPLDCPSSTPVRQRAFMKKGLLGSGGGGTDLATDLLSPPRWSFPKRKSSCVSFVGTSH